MYICALFANAQEGQGDIIGNYTDLAAIKALACSMLPFAQSVSSQANEPAIAVYRATALNLRLSRAHHSQQS